MPARVVKCGDCGAATLIADGDWNEVQRAQIDAWTTGHTEEFHEGAEVAIEINPSPLTDA